MSLGMAETRRAPGVCYATAEDGLLLPVVDVTHPEFALEDDPAALAANARATLRQLQRSARLPQWVLRVLSRRSILMRGSMAASGTFVSGMTTYLLKLGPDHLGSASASRLDRKLSSSLSPVCLRMRLRDTARLLADAIASLSAAPAARVELLNIGGGTGIDSLNALVILKKERPALLAGRRWTVHVVDLDRQSPRFGARALAALRADGGPLAGLEADFRHVEGRWDDPASLQAAFEAIGRDALVAASSEGGLFEYGSDAAIAAVLLSLRERYPAGCAFVGSLMRDEPVPRVIRDVSKTALRLFTPKRFAGLVESAGWILDRSLEGNPLYGVFSLRPGPARGGPGQPA